MRRLLRCTDSPRRCVLRRLRTALVAVCVTLWFGAYLATAAPAADAHPFGASAVWCRWTSDATGERLMSHHVALHRSLVGPSELLAREPSPHGRRQFLDIVKVELRLPAECRSASRRSTRSGPSSEPVSCSSPRSSGWYTASDSRSCWATWVSIEQRSYRHCSRSHRDRDRSAGGRRTGHASDVRIRPLASRTGGSHHRRDRRSGGSCHMGARAQRRDQEPAGLRDHSSRRSPVRGRRHDHGRSADGAAPVSGARATGGHIGEARTHDGRYRLVWCMTRRARGIVIGRAFRLARSGRGSHGFRRTSCAPSERRSCR